MANEQNLKKGEATQFRSGEEAARNGKKGGIKSGESRREKKTIQNILNDYLSEDVSGHKELRAIAKEAGIKHEQSIKELVTAVCILNTLKKGDVEKLQRLAELLGEETQYENGNGDVEATLAIIKECAYADRDKQETS